MSFMITATGARYEHGTTHREVRLPDVAHHLAQINRFTGACRRPYSVAEHSLLVCEIAEREHGLPPIGLLAALLHDAHEAYIGDLNSPLKGHIGEPWRRMEAEEQQHVLRHFKCAESFAAFHSVIRTADLQALATERRDLMPADGSVWPVLDGIEPIGWVRLTDRDGMDWTDWRTAFVDRFDELHVAMAARVATLRVQRTGSATERLALRLLDPEDLAWAATPEIRDAAREALGMQSGEAAR
jgi:hypothetical protein